MKATVINSSPHRKCGNTSLILTPFLDSLKEQGVEVKLFYTKTEKIQPCTGCYTCWYKSPGICSIHDNMEKILTHLRESEIWVFASPIYAVGMTGPLKTVLDRLLPLSKPFVSVRDGQCRLTFYDDVKVKKIVLVSSCGFWNMENFQTIIDEISCFSEKINAQFAGKLLRPSGDFFRIALKSGASVDDIIHASSRAAVDLIGKGAVSEECEKIVSRRIMSFHDSIDAFNIYAEKEWQSISHRSDMVDSHGEF